MEWEEKNKANDVKTDPSESIMSLVSTPMVMVSVRHKLSQHCLVFKPVRSTRKFEEFTKVDNNERRDGRNCPYIN